MRKMKSRVLAVLMAAGMIFTAQGMTVLAGTTGIGAAKTASQTGGPGEVKQDIGTVTVDDTQETSGETGQNTDTPLQVNYSVYFRNQGWSDPAADNQALSASSESWVTSMKANLINIPSGVQIGVRYKVNLSGTGWLDWKADGVENGGASAEKPLEAIAMELTGSSAASYDLYYKVYQNGSWTTPVKNGETAGTEGQGLRVDGLWVTVTGKGAEVPEGPNGKSVDPTRPMVALTFDDGPSKYTPRILDSLEANGGRATFFMVASSELTKEIDFSSAVTRITQKYEYWCVYACLESLNTSLPQCTHCFNFLHRFYMNGASNPYQLVSDEDFKDAIDKLEADADETCNSSDIYEKFGVSGESLDAYLLSEGFSESSMGSFIRKISKNDEGNPSITFFIDMDGNTGHCVVFLGSKLYNNSWDDPKSKIYLMNPAFESIREVTLTEINDTYNIIYCK